MKQKKLIKELNLSEKDFEEIKNKIEEIELKTSGEFDNFSFTICKFH